MFREILPDENISEISKKCCVRLFNDEHDLGLGVKPLTSDDDLILR